MKKLLTLALIAASALVLAPSAAPPALATITCPTLGTADTSITLAHGSANPHLDESSGIVASSDYTNTNTVWDHEDGGGGNVVYAHNGNTGALRATITLSTFSNVDWEDIDIARTTGTDTVVVSDTGDNSHNRTNTKLLAFPEPDPASGDASVTPTSYPITFKDSGGTTVHPNVEGFVIDQGGASNKDVLFFAKETDNVYGANSSGSGRFKFSVYDAGQFGSLSAGVENDATYVASIAEVSAGEWSAGHVGTVAANIDVNRNYLVLKNYAEALLWPRNGTWVNTLTTSADGVLAPGDAPCVLATGSGKYEGVAFSYDVSKLFQVKDDAGCNCDTPLKQQTFTP